MSTTATHRIAFSWRPGRHPTDEDIASLIGHPVKVHLDVEGQPYPFAGHIAEAELGDDGLLHVMCEVALPRPDHGDPGTDTKGRRG